MLKCAVRRLPYFVASLGVMGGGGLGGMGAAAAQTPQMKSQIELFVGNIPVGTTQQGLVDFLNAAMLKVQCACILTTCLAVGMVSEMCKGVGYRGGEAGGVGGGG